MPELERELRDLGPALDWPATPDVAPAVQRRIESEPRRARWAPSRRALVVAIAVLAVAVGAVLAVPQARTAVLEWLGLRGVSVERVETLPTVPEGRSDPLGLGDAVTASEAAGLVDFPLPDPARVGLGEPDEIRHARFVGEDGQVAYVWVDDEGEFEAVLTVFRAGLDARYIEKMAGAGTEIRSVRIGGRVALWLSGEPHAFLYVTPAGDVRDETLRLARNTLLWERGELLYRLEGDFTLVEARRIAERLD
jgi:hypothetical protein